MAEGTATETVAVGNASSIPPDDLLVVEDESPETLYAMMEEHGWGDGLPVVFPTEARVEPMLAGYPGSVDEVLAVLPPRSGAATVKTVAVNAVMAGCPPEVFPVIVAAVRALGEPRAQSAERAGHHPLGRHHGGRPRRDRRAGRLQRRLRDLRAGLAGQRHHGTGHPARPAPRRPGADPGDGDASTQGQPAKYGFCFAENAAGQPVADLPPEPRASTRRAR